MQEDSKLQEAFIEHSSHSEAEIRAYLAEFAKAVRAGDLTQIMSFYSDELVAFDMMPPLQYTNKSEYQKLAWQECFTDYFAFPVDFEHVDLRVHADGDVAFTHSLLHMKGKSKKGEVMEAWMRTSAGLQKIDGHWLITHEHNSVPLDKDTGAGLMNLAP